MGTEKQKYEVRNTPMGTITGPNKSSLLRTAFYVGTKNPKVKKIKKPYFA